MTQVKRNAAVNFLTASFIPTKIDAGLLIVRIGAGLSLFLKHGLEKITHFSQMAPHFPNPLHIGAVPSLTFSLLSDSICSILVVFGLFTRWAALIVFINIFAAWSLVHHFLFFGPRADHGELVFLYIVVYLGLVFTGPGRCSIDRRLE